MSVRSICVALALAVSQAFGLRRGGLALSRDAFSIATRSATTNGNIRAYNMSVPIDHFHNETKYEPHSDGFFNLRYWADISHYKKGGPVIILHSGELPTEGRLPFLDHGIASILIKATGGVGIVLEHRYYGTSWPTQNATTESYRFLTTDQALADTAYFSKHLQISGLEHVNLTAPETPHILYGGSYAGGFVAFARKVYPDVFWGAISSSGVTMAIDDFWQLDEATRNWAPGECSPTLQKLVSIIDHTLLGQDPVLSLTLKGMFGLKDLWNDEFASFLMEAQPSIQETNWDPAEDSINFGLFCATISSNSLLFKGTEQHAPRVRELVEHAGYSGDSESITIRMLNYIGYTRDHVNKSKRQCESHRSLRECLSVRYAQGDTKIDVNGWQRSWLYQTCTEWGYFTSGASTPKDRSPMVSRVLTAEFSSYLCQSWFNITSRPNVDIINRHGGFNFSYPRVALIDGKQDPWRSAGVHASHLTPRKSTPSEPFELIDWGVHHWDENGIDPHKLDVDAGLPPAHVSRMQQKEVKIVQQWLSEFKREDDQFNLEL